MRPADEKTKKDVVNLIRQGHSRQTICNTLEISERTFYRMSSGVNLKLVKKLAGDKDLELASMQIYKSLGLPLTQIARQFGVSPQYVSEVLQ